MGIRILASLAILCLAAGAQAPRERAMAAPQSHAQRPRTQAHVKITVRNSQATPWDLAAGPPLSEIRLNETFSGDLDGESSVRALEVRRDDRSSSLISLQRFEGTLQGRYGTFVLQGSETVQNGKIKAQWSIVPGSGTGNLSGLRGEGGFEGDFGKGSDGTLDYWFE